MRVIGIDPGTRHLGWGVVERVGTRLSHVAHGVIDTDTEAGLAGRLVEIDDALMRVIEEHRPEVGAVESLFFAKDAQSAAKLGHARGVVLLRLSRAGMELFEYPPALVKRTVVGRGAAEKRQVAMVITAMLRLTEAPRADAADALAIAVTHLQAAGFHSAVKAVTERVEAAVAAAGGRAAKGVAVAGAKGGRGRKRSPMSAALRARVRGTT